MDIRTLRRLRGSLLEKVKDCNKLIKESSERIPTLTKDLRLISYQDTSTEFNIFKNLLHRKILLQEVIKDIEQYMIEEPDEED